VVIWIYLLDISNTRRTRPTLNARTIVNRLYEIMILFSFTIYIFKGKEKGNPKYHQLNGSRDKLKQWFDDTTFMQNKIVTLTLFFIQSTASETVLLCLLAARTRTITKYKKENPEMNEVEIISKLVGYCSTQVWALSFSRNFCFNILDTRLLPKSQIQTG
jgi:hypothetical protein